MVLVIAGLESMAMLGIIVIVVSSGQLRSGEALSRSLGWAILEIYGLPYLILAMPALLLAALNRYLPVALVLTCWPFRPCGWSCGMPDGALDGVVIHRGAIACRVGEGAIRAFTPVFDGPWRLPASAPQTGSRPNVGTAP
ncbi:MAG TPA: hypothetical protein VGI22_07560 [Xanthobacteraceae bacterium]